MVISLIKSLVHVSYFVSSLMGMGDYVVVDVMLVLAVSGRSTTVLCQHRTCNCPLETVSPQILLVSEPDRAFKSFHYMQVASHTNETFKKRPTALPRSGLPLRRNVSS